MRYTKGKWIASVKDTYSVEISLNKIVLAHITKLYECLKKSECHGVPMYYVDQVGSLDNASDEVWTEIVSKANELRIKDLEELIWVFSDNEPDIVEYGFTYDFGRDVPNGSRCTNPEGRELYHNALKAWDERKKSGYKLFGEIYSDLSW